MCVSETNARIHKQTQLFNKRNVQCQISGADWDLQHVREPTSIIWYGFTCRFDWEYSTFVVVFFPKSDVDRLAIDHHYKSRTIREIVLLESAWHLLCYCKLEFQQISTSIFAVCLFVFLAWAPIANGSDTMIDNAHIRIYSNQSCRHYICKYIGQVNTIKCKKVCRHRVAQNMCTNKILMYTNIYTRFVQITWQMATHTKQKKKTDID